MIHLLLLLSAALAEEPQPEPPSHPPLGEWMALEIQDGPSAPRRSTRDEALVTPLLEQMDSARWRTSPMPRCRHQLRIRLVPPGAEGGLIATMCNSGGDVYVAFPDGATYALDGESSYGFWRASRKLAEVDGVPIAPLAVTENLDSLRFEARFQHKALTKELELHAPDAKPQTRAPHHALAEGEADKLVAALEGAGFFLKATRVHRPAVDEPGTDPPEGSVDAVPESDAVGMLQLTVTVGDWDRSWRLDAHPTLFHGVTHQILTHEAVPEAAEAIHDLDVAPKPVPQPIPVDEE